MCCCCSQFNELIDHLVLKELPIRLTVRVFLYLLVVCVSLSLLFLERDVNLIFIIPESCLSVYFAF